MNAIGDLYESICLEDLHYKDIEEYTNAVEMVREFLNKSISLERSKRNELDDLIVINRCAAQKQGFEIGFKYAMSLIKECGLKWLLIKKYLRNF